MQPSANLTALPPHSYYQQALPAVEKNVGFIIQKIIVRENRSNLKFTEIRKHKGTVLVNLNYITQELKPSQCCI